MTEKVYPPNLELRAARLRHNWTLKQAARELRLLMASRGDTQAGVTLHHIHRWEQGGRRPGMRYRHYLCLLYGMKPEQLGFAPPEYLEPALVTCARQAAQSGTDRRAAYPAGDGLEELNVTRRKLLAASGLLSAALAVESAADAAERTAEAVDRAARVASGRAAADDRMIAELDRFVAGFERSCLRASGDLLVEPLRAHVGMVKTMLKQSLLPAQREALLRNASQAASLMSNIQLFARGDRSTARQWLTEGVEMAEATTDPGVHVLGLVRSAELCTYSGRGTTSVLLLDHARTLAERACSPGIVSWVLATKAEARAALRQPEEVPRLLDQAAEAQRRARPGTVQSFAAWWGRLQIAGYTGAAYMRLEQPGPARTALQEALALAPADFKHRSILVADLAMTYAQEHEVTMACELGGKALDIAGSMHCQNTLERLTAMRQRLQPRASARAVKELDERLAAVAPV